MGNPPRDLGPLFVRGGSRLRDALQTPRELLAPRDDLAGKPGSQHKGEHCRGQQDWHRNQPGDNAPLDQSYKKLHDTIVRDRRPEVYRVCP
ncbi:MAG: hypothetical protein QNJ81_00675 [Acidimicrobiia bacterium]|nr:hypothetical protein [Acidimicrobiia bacterium]